MKRGNGERGPDKGIRKGSPLHGKPGPRAGLRSRRDKAGIQMARALEMLLDGIKVKEIARALGVSVPTIYNWMNEPSFAAELHDGRDQIVNAAKLRAAVNADTLIQQLLDLSGGATKDDMAKVHATREALAIAGVTRPAALEIDISGGLDRLSDEQLFERMKGLVEAMKEAEPEPDQEEPAAAP